MLSRVVLALAGLMLGQEALANGRFPNAGMVVRGRGASANTVMLQATFGVIVSRDRGASWQWICEEAYSEPSGWDPPIAVTASGALLLGMPDGLRNSSDGCSWHREGPALPVSDIAWDASLEHLVVAYASSFAPPQVYLSDDAGQRWRPGATLSPGLTIDTVEMSALDPRLLWVSTNNNNRDAPALWRSTDGGLHFERLNVTLGDAQDLYVSGVDPARAGRLWVRATRGAATHLWESTDRGDTFREIASTRTAMLGFAVSDDGDTLWIASENTQAPLLRAVRGGAFAPLPVRVAPRCLRQSEGVLYLCTDNATDGYAVGCSRDQGQSVEALMRFADLSGPLRCDADSGVAQQCTPRWALTRSTLGLADPRDVPPPRGHLDAVFEAETATPDDVEAPAGDNPAADLGRDGETRDAGARIDTPNDPTADLATLDTRDAYRDVAAEGATPQDTAPQARHACACSVARKPHAAGRLWSILGVAVGLTTQRKRSRFHQRNDDA